MAKDWRFFGATLSVALLRRSTLPWSIIVVSTVRFLIGGHMLTGIMSSETGGLFRIAIKLMMACATTNVDVYVLIYMTLLTQPDVR